MVMSDWTGTNSVAEAIAAGCDVEMPGPTKWRGSKAVEAVKNGSLTREHVAEAAANVIGLIERTKGLHGPKEQPERADDVPERRSLIRKLGHEGLTVLKNEGVLPLKDGQQSIALIGPNVKRAIAGGGGSASLKPYYNTTPWEGFQKLSKSKLTYARGCDTAKWLPLLSEADCMTPSGKPGVILEYYHGDKFEGKPAHVQHKHATDLFLWDSAPKDVLPAYSFKVKCTVTPSKTGLHTIGFMTVGPGRLYVNQELFIDNWEWTEEGEAMFDGSVDVLKKIHLEGGKKVDITVESNNEIRPRSKMSFEGSTHQYGGCRIGYEEEVTVDLLQEAVDVAREADAVVLVVGLDAEWESEGYDRGTMDLPRDGNQDKLIEAIIAVNPNTVVVNQSGTPVTMPWADSVSAIVQGYYQGQEAGNALADVVLGHVNPSGKLPVTFPRLLSDNPAYHNWPGENLKVNYGEGLYIGYRHYERANIAPRFAFGHGLSYTSFAYGEAQISEQTLHETSQLTITVPVTNTGDREGSETVQAYIRDPKSRIPRPQKELQAFAKTSVQPGETVQVKLTIDKYAVGYYDTSVEAWIAEEGVFEVLIGASSADIRYFSIARVRRQVLIRLQDYV
jgi:beta-glucosidase